MSGFLFGFLALASLGELAHLASAPLIFPSLGPTAFLLYHHPQHAASSPRNAIVGHLIGAACGVFALAATGLLDAPNALQAGVTPARAIAAGLSLGLTSAMMISFDRSHPPAAATTLIVGLGLMRDPLALAALMVGVAALVALGWATHRAFGTPYPLWSPSDG